MLFTARLAFLVVVLQTLGPGAGLLFPRRSPRLQRRLRQQPQNVRLQRRPGEDHRQSPGAHSMRRILLRRERHRHRCSRVLKSLENDLFIADFPLRIFHCGFSIAEFEKYI